MKINLCRPRVSIIIVICLLYLLLLILQPFEVHAYELVYTIQISSLTEIDGAREEYDFLIDKLNQKDLDYLRVEKIGQYYSVRLGKFADRTEAEKINKSLKRFHPSAFIMEAYIKDERIIKQYHRTSTEDEKKIPSGRSSISEPEMHEAIPADDKIKTEAPESGDQEKEDISIKDEPLVSAADSADDISKTEAPAVAEEKKGDMSIKDESVISATDSADDKRKTEASAVAKEKKGDTFVKEEPVISVEDFVDDKIKAEDHGVGDQKKGDMYVKDGRLISAAEEYRNAIRKDPDNPDLTIKLANTLKDLRLLDQAIIQMKKVADASTDNNTNIRVELGKLYLTAGKPGKAKEQFLAAVKMNPGSADIHYYLGVVYMREADYEMAWFAAKSAESLGYKSQDLINILSILSEEPRRVPGQETGKSMYIRHIVVHTQKEAEEVLRKHSEQDLFNRISDHELTEQHTISKVFIGEANSSNMHPKIARALRNREVFADPVIVETDFGFHIVQRIMPLSPYFKK